MMSPVPNLTEAIFFAVGGTGVVIYCVKQLWGVEQILRRPQYNMLWGPDR
jgi:hypothetical protein